MGVLLHAASAVASGAAEVVVAYRAIRARSGATRFGGAKVAPSPTSGHAGTTAMQWCMPFGVLTPASWMALNSTRYMHEFGVRSEDIGRAVVQLRAYALTNPAAWGYQRPMTLEDHQASRWIVEPCIHLLDCCRRPTDPSPSSLPARTRQSPAAVAGDDRGRRRCGPVRTGDRLGPLPRRSLGDGRVGGLGRRPLRFLRFTRRTSTCHDLRRVLPDPFDATRGARVLRARGAKDLWRRETWAPTAPCRAIRTAVLSARATSTV